MRGLRQALAVGAAVLVFLAILLTGSRAGLLATGLGYAGVTATLLASRSGRMRKSALGLLFLPSIFFLILLGSGTQTRTLERFERLGRGNDPVAIKSRWDVVRYGLKSVIQRPLWGHGIGCFHLAYQQVRPALLTGEVYMNVAHNDYMQWLVETGIPGLLLWIALLALSLARCWRSYRSPTPWVAGQIGSLLAIGAYTSLNFACPVPADLLWIGAIFGLSAALPGLKTAPAVAPWAPRAFPIVAVIAGIALWTVRLGWTTIREVEAEKRAAKAEATLDWESAVAEIRPALERQPQNQRLQLRLAELAKRAFVLTGAPVWLDTQEKALREAYQASPQDPRTLLSLISFFQEQLRPDLAEPYLEQAQAQAPYSVEVRRAAARSLILQGKFSQATTSLSDLERTGVSVDDSALADLIFLLENKARGQGTLVLSKVAATDPDRCADLALAAAATAQHRKNYEVALALLKQARYLATNRPDVAWEIANTRNLAGESQLEFSYLDKLRRDRVVELDDQIMQKVWKRWAELAVQHGQLDLVIAQLEDYLIVHRNENWARIALSEVYLKRGLKAEARSALRSGLSFDRDGALRVRLGDLCASQGLPELARGYYREALPLSSMPKEIESKLKQLKLSQDNLDELEP